MKIKLILCICFIGLNLFGQEDTFIAPVSYKQIAQEWATIQYDGIVDDGTPYYSLNGTFSSWIFNVYRKGGSFPSENEILSIVKSNYEQRLSAEFEGNSSLIREFANAMRCDSDYATIFVSGTKDNPYVSSSYPGLPPHILSIYDANDKIKDVFPEPDDVKFIYVDPFNVYAKYKKSSNKAFVNLLFPDGGLAHDIELRKPEQKTDFDSMNGINSKMPINLQKAFADAEISISGVPDYKSEHPDSNYRFKRGCVPVSAAMALGYWDDRGYSNLIDGGGSTYAGSKSTDGYLGFINNTLGPDLGWVSGSGVYFPYSWDDIETTCNDTNSYDFNCVYDSYCSWTEYCDEIDAGRPFLLEYGSYAWIQLTDSSWAKTAEHAVTAVGYKYINDGTYDYNRWFIIHYNSYYVGNPYFLCDSALYDSPSRITVTPGGGSWTGSLNYDTMWSGDVTITGDVTIPAGKTLTILPGTTVSFDDSDDQSGGRSSSRPEIVVNGTLKADDATFTATSKGDWYGIVFNSGASSSSYLEDCLIEKAYDAVYIDGSDPTIEDCEIKDADLKGVVIVNSGAEPTIKECYIHSCDSYPLQISNTSTSKPDILDNKIYGGSTSAVFVSYSSANFAENEFRTSSGSTSWGVYVIGSTSNPDFDSKYGDTGNLFDLANISSHGAYLSGGSPEFGDSGPHDGDNDFLNRGTDKFIYNNTGSTINAEENYWDGTPSATLFSGNVDYTPYDASSNSAGPSWKRMVSPYLVGNEKFEDGKYEEALTALKSALSQDTESEKASIAVFKMAQSALALGKLSNEESFLKSLSNSSNAEVQHMSRVWLAYLYAMQEKLNEAE